MRTVATIEARMQSTRLPGKVMKEVLGKPLLELMIERVRRARRVDDIVIATTDHLSCDPIMALAVRIGVRCYRGSEDDVLDRVLKAAASAKADVIVELTGDCPLIDPSVIDRVVDVYYASGVDYCANVLERTYPAGMDTQVFAYHVLEDAARMTQDPSDREHVSLYIYTHPERFSLKNVESGLPVGLADWRLVVDVPEDFELIRRVYESLYELNPEFAMDDIRDLFVKHPDWLEINRFRKTAL
jgi:spore coat polysaccharide biosynthesis protein SpsF